MVNSKSIFTIQHDTADTPEFAYCTARHRPSTADLNGYQVKLFMNAVQLDNCIGGRIGRIDRIGLIDRIGRIGRIGRIDRIGLVGLVGLSVFFFFSLALLPFCGRINLGKKSAKKVFCLGDIAKIGSLTLIPTGGGRFGPPL